MRHYCGSCAVVEVSTQDEYCEGCLNSMLIDMQELWNQEEDAAYLEMIQDKHDDLCYSYAAQMYLF